MCARARVCLYTTTVFVRRAPDGRTTSYSKFVSMIIGPPLRHVPSRYGHLAVPSDLVSTRLYENDPNRWLSLCDARVHVVGIRSRSCIHIYIYGMCMYVRMYIYITGSDYHYYYYYYGRSVRVRTTGRQKPFFPRQFARYRHRTLAHRVFPVAPPVGPRSPAVDSPSRHRATDRHVVHGHIAHRV